MLSTTGNEPTAPSRWRSAGTSAIPNATARLGLIWARSRSFPASVETTALRLRRRRRGNTAPLRTRADEAGQAERPRPRGRRRRGRSSRAAGQIPDTRVNAVSPRSSWCRSSSEVRRRPMISSTSAPSVASLGNDGAGVAPVTQDGDPVGDVAAPRRDRARRTGPSPHRRRSPARA